MNRTYLISALALALATAACGPGEPAPGFQATLPPPPVPAFGAPANGSIFQVSAGYAPLHIGNRARAVGDPLTVMLVESVRTSKSASSSTSREGGFSLSPPATGPFSFLSPDALSASGQSAFDGQGSAAQTSSLSGTLSVTIAELYPNGTALVRGQKLLDLSQGQEWVQFSGIVRLTDVDSDNRITSNRIADARIIYSGRGAVQVASREGWLSRFFNFATPF